tara:strand:- start:2 stop:367 length:366 start_codon:yes stop_codon:yes gene_type:complete
MPYADPEREKQCKAEWYQKNKKELNRKSYSVTKQWRLDNPEKIRKANLKSNWKRRGVLLNTWYYTFDELYDWYLKTNVCERCHVTLSKDKKRSSTTKCLHHDHESGEFEMIVCHACNTRLG